MIIMPEETAWAVVPWYKRLASRVRVARVFVRLGMYGVAWSCLWVRVQVVS